MGFGALSGIIGGLANVREMGPLVAGIAFAAQCGCRMTAEIGSMRIAEEIDALEAMGLRPIPFVVGTRLIGGLLCVIPGYALTLLTSFFVVERYDPRVLSCGRGNIQSLFCRVLIPTDLVYSTVKATAFCCCGDSDPLLLRLFRLGRASRRGPSVWACGASEPGGGDDAGLLADGNAVGTQTNVRVQRVDGSMTLLNTSAESETRILTRIGIIVVLFVVIAAVFLYLAVNPFARKPHDVISAGHRNTVRRPGRRRRDTGHHARCEDRPSRVGSSIPGGGVRLETDLQPGPTRGLTDAMGIDYRPSNYFGVTGINVIPAKDGRPLQNGMQLKITPTGKLLPTGIDLSAW